MTIARYFLTCTLPSVTMHVIIGNVRSNVHVEMDLAVIGRGVLFVRGFGIDPRADFNS